MEFAELVVPVQLGTKEYKMRFSANTMCAFENATGKFYLDVVQKIYEIMFPKGHEDAEGNIVPVRVSGADILRKVAMSDVRALLWASLHDYDKDDNPIWPLTINQVGRQLTFHNVIPIFIKYLTGASSNSPSKSELGESQAEAKNKTHENGFPPIIPDSGGEHGIELPAGALD